MKTRHLALSILGLLVGAAAASAYVLNGPKWGVDQIPYYINPVNADMSEADAVASIQAGAMTWTAQSNAGVMMYYMGRTSGSSLTRNNKNEMFFRSTSAGSMAAEAYWWYDSSYRLVEADIVFYDGGFKFFPGSTGCSSGVYLVDIATHEFGHALGLGHSGVASASMYPKVSWCSTATRSLDADDLAGIEKLYPAGATTNTAPTVNISTPSSGSSFDENVPTSFSGSASDYEDGSLGASLVWLSSRDGQIGTGTSFQRVLSVGSHTITAKVTDSNGAVAQAQRSVTVQATATIEPTPDGFTLSGTAYKVKGVQRVDLRWSGSTAGSIDVFRNGVRVAITANDGSHTDALNRKGGGTYTYKLCAATTSTCSNQITIQF